MKDPVEVQLPGGDGFLVVLRVCKSRQYIPSTLLDDFFLDSCHGSTIKGAVSGGIQYSIYHNRWLDSRRQLSNRFEHGLTELAHLPPVHSPIKRSTHIRAGQTEFDIVQFVDHRVLAICEHGAFGYGEAENVP